MKKLGVENPAALLFRCNTGEILAFAKCKTNEEMEKLFAGIKTKDLRWKVIFHKFVQEKEKTVS